MKTIQVEFQPGDVVRYYSGRYGYAYMIIAEVRMNWTEQNGIIVKYAGYPEYNKVRNGRYSLYTWIYDLKNIELIKVKN